MALPIEVENFIENYQSALEKELMYINKHDWSIEPKVRMREKIHLRQYLITNRNLSKLKAFAELTTECRNYKSVQSFIDLLVEFMDIYIERYEYCTVNYDWTTYEETFDQMSPEEVDELIGIETEFQSEVLNNVTRIRLEMKKMNLTEAVDSVNLPIHADKSIPLLMKNKIENLYPNIKEYMKNKYVKKEETK